jgi:DNA polymerase-1
VPLHNDTNLYLVNTIDDVYRMRQWLRESREVLGFDTETSGLDAFAPNAELRMIQIGDTRTGWAVPFKRWGGAALECLDAWTGEYAAHNLPFDATWLKVHADWEVPYHRAHDTAIMSRIDRPNKNAGLKEVTTELIDPSAADGEKALKAAFKKYNWDWDTVPIDFEDYWFYGALDPVLAAHLFAYFRTDKKYPKVYDLEMSVQRICWQMQHRGMRIDTDYSQVKYNELTALVEKNLEFTEKEWGIELTSNPQLAEYLQSIGAEFEKFGEKSGVPSVDKEVMGKLLLSDNLKIRDAAKLVLETKSASKLSSAYFGNFLSMNVDGIVHPNIRTLGARTGRMSVTTPALQTIPRGDALVRDAFIPTNEDERIVSCDYSQVEMRLLAHFSGDAKLQNAFKEADATGGDFFVTLGREIYADPTFSKKDARRGLVKSTLYGAAYGSGLEKMATTAGVTYGQMEQVSKSVFAAFPGIKSFMSEIEAVGKKRERSEGQGYILTPSDRRLPCDEGKVYALTNYMLQGTAAELMKKAILRLDAAGYTEYLRMPIHDEMIFSLPLAGHEEAMKDIEELMSYCNGEFGVDLPAEPEGPLSRWGEKYRKEGEIFGYDADSLLAAA